MWLQNTFNAFSEIKGEFGNNNNKKTEKNAQHTKSNRILHTKLNNKFHVFSVCVFRCTLYCLRTCVQCVDCVPIEIQNIVDGYSMEAS